ncbi:MAG: DUF721 domain-containing protein [Rickettsiaceae bacterium]|nr:DUF721 domain-containing protein [Rickettsiaceae bacterium]
MTHKSIAYLVANYIKKISSHKGDDFAEIVANWPKIIGSNLSRMCFPVSLKYYKMQGYNRAELTISAKTQFAKLELEFSSGIIIERINMYLGRNNISKIRVKNI